MRVKFIAGLLYQICTLKQLVYLFKPVAVDGLEFVLKLTRTCYSQQVTSRANAMQGAEVGLLSFVQKKKRTNTKTAR